MFSTNGVNAPVSITIAGPAAAPRAGAWPATTVPTSPHSTLAITARAQPVV